jgi:hypothetical protein
VSRRKRAHIRDSQGHYIINTCPPLGGYRVQVLNTEGDTDIKSVLRRRGGTDVGSVLVVSCIIGVLKCYLFHLEVNKGDSGFAL